MPLALTSSSLGKPEKEKVVWAESIPNKKKFVIPEKSRIKQ
jgi:hypothetical protein